MPSPARLFSSSSRVLVIGVLAALFLAPLVVMLAGSLRPPGLPPPRGVELLPQGAGLAAYVATFELVPFARALFNSALLAALMVPLSVLTASWAGLALAQSSGWRWTTLAGTVLLLEMVPVTAVWLTRFAVFKVLGLTGTAVPLVAPALMGGSPLFVLLYAVAFRRLPPELFEAARLEGAGPLRLWRSIALPLVQPTTAAVALLAFILSWSNFIDPLLYLSGEDALTAPLALHALELLGSTQWPVLLAGAVVVTLPAVLAFLGAQRMFLGEERGSGWLGR
ncbi:carbohydrate ABC transporter permease [Pyxidicoccus xibeiensis]|uniref:carbohydrate ABC transporter permease n=1 Tax=Pyxidicoccus xibeiensis TaxID=2906759 RepID=UPI0020A78CF0|nr:carbohydrate ABC transporter permease [Pyxidicoccus xibeiensis]MCP3141633.1 carbohydrate ABC transporter permease [Pyxidicoccus xibeiensis]